MENKNSNSMRKAGKRIWETLHAFVSTQELRCLLFWCLFPGVFRNLSWQGWLQLRTPGRTLLQRLVLALVHEAFLPLQVWILPRSFHLRSLLWPATSTWGVFTPTRYFHLRSLYSDSLLPLEESLLWPATFTWGLFTLTRYFHLRNLYSDPLLPLEEFLSL